MGRAADSPRPSPTSWCSGSSSCSSPTSTAIQFDPERQAETIQRQGGFIPGIRPGRATVRHLEHVLSRITLAGSLYLALVAVAPSILGWLWDIPVGLSGVSILIVAGVALETMKQIESQLMMRNYEGFLT